MNDSTIGQAFHALLQCMLHFYLEPLQKLVMEEMIQKLFPLPHHSFQV